MSRGERKSKNSLIPSTTTAPEVSPVDFSQQEADKQKEVGAGCRTESLPSAALVEPHTCTFHQHGDKLHRGFLTRTVCVAGPGRQ